MGSKWDWSPSELFLLHIFHLLTVDEAVSEEPCGMSLCKDCEMQLLDYENDEGLDDLTATVDTYISLDLLSHEASYN